MRDKRMLPELLSPAGTFEHLKAAVRAGADAVYMGGDRFGARAYAGNLAAEEISDALHYTHLHDRKLYLTVNTLMKEDELYNSLYGFLQPYYEAGLDGVIVQDLGTASFIHRNFPDLELHASTQMTITHTAGALAARELGMSRIVPARELSLEELVQIREASGLEMEVFIHGALCCSYSGQCLLSSWYGGRSGNRGRCAQPCRLPCRRENGKQACYLSLRDLCSVSMIPEIVSAGFDSLKIEGRMKNKEYTAGVTAIYRRYLDLYADLCREGKEDTFRVAEEDLHALEELYCRGGFTEGYWHRHNGPSMMAEHTQKNLGRLVGRIRSVKRNRIEISLQDALAPKDLLVVPLDHDKEIILTVPASQEEGLSAVLNVPDGRKLRPGMSVYRRWNARLMETIHQEITDRKISLPARAQVIVRKDRPIRALLTCRGLSVTVEGPCPGAAVHRALSREDIERQFRKTGGTPFVLKEFSLDLEPGCFLPLSTLKGIRQEAYSRLEERLSTEKDRLADRMGAAEQEKRINSSSGDKRTGHSSLQERTAFVYDREILARCLDSDYYTAICLSADAWPVEDLPGLCRDIENKGKRACLSLPHIMRHGRDRWNELCEKIPWQAVYVHNINEAYWLAGLAGYQGERIGSASFYQWNTGSLETARSLTRLDAFQLPLEYDAAECRKLVEAIRSRGSMPAPELLVYGRVPLMVTAQCQKKNAGRCDQVNGLTVLTDSRGRKLPVSSHCACCYNKIWSHEPADRTGRDYDSLLPYVDRTAFDFFLADPGLPDLIADRCRRWQKKEYSLC